MALRHQRFRQLDRHRGKKGAGRISNLYFHAEWSIGPGETQVHRDQFRHLLRLIETQEMSAFVVMLDGGIALNLEEIAGRVIFLVEPTIPGLCYGWTKPGSTWTSI